MKKLVMDDDKKIEDYIKKEFGSVESCCGVIMPPLESVIEIFEPLETCHECIKPLSSSFIASMARMFGTFLEDNEAGLDENYCIPPGTYTVVFFEGNHNLPHWAHIEPVNGGHEIKFCAGNCGDAVIDWRGARKSPLSPPEEKRIDRKLEKMAREADRRRALKNK
ncbi:hypothetical protein EPN15_03410 [Patescibacteria group bacterium]|nr:MAG: hypothetical protein EPN15_03410 [Patescibacteria group bacterium]